MSECDCVICQQTRRIKRLTTTRWIRRRTLQQELDHLYDAYFEECSERSLSEAYIKDIRMVVNGHG